MALDVGATFKGRDIIPRYQRVPARFRPLILRFLRRVGRNVIAQVTKERLSGRPGLISRTGRLQRSLKTRVVFSNFQYKLQFFTRSPYARTHEKGMTIVPTVARRLAIPSAFFRVGGDPGGTPVQPWPPRLSRSVYKLSKEFKDALVLRDQPALVTHWLRRSVRIPARFRFIPTVKKSLSQQLRTIRDEIAKEFS